MDRLNKEAVITVTNLIAFIDLTSEHLFTSATGKHIASHQQYLTNTNMVLISVYYNVQMRF